MGSARLAVYLIGLLLVVGAVWVFLTQTDPGRRVPTGVALALILLLVGVGVMASAKSINDSRTTRRVVHDGPTTGRVYETAPPPRAYAPGYVEETYAPGETVVEERRYD
ncbi:MAG TPA: hypothetical protein VHH36_04485 [Candidatus Thermoplasmatota archaeon]|nr:hypothetical protein [Candidatus Thermoplasmatota archaeon]